MNREKAKESINTSYDEDEHYENMDAIDKIFDDFESRVCENCIIWTENKRHQGDCKMFGLVTNAEMSCKFFKRKDT